MSVFEIDELRRKILGYIYPESVKVGMKVNIVSSIFVNKPYIILSRTIYKIIKHKNNTHTIIIKTEPKVDELENNMWYCVHTYLYPEHGDVIKVVRYD